MTTRLEKTLKREIMIRGRPFVIALSPEGLKLTLKGRRKGQELRWSDLVSGEAALAVALNASLGQFAGESSAHSAQAASSAQVASSAQAATKPATARAQVRSAGNSKSRKRARKRKKTARADRDSR